MIPGNTTEYANGYVYEGGSLQFFPQAEGYISPKNPSDLSLGFNYVYQYKDHLGNIRLSYTDSDPDPEVETLEIIEENNYYPFGLKMRGFNEMNSALGNSVAQRWKFGGNEYQEELNLGWYDITARNYNPELGRWMNIDPLADKFPQISSYVYTLNNPINFVDFDGREPDPILLSVVMKAIQNAPKAIAEQKIARLKEQASGRRIGNEKRTILSSVPWTEKYAYKGGFWNALIGRNEIKFNAEIDAFGKSFKGRIIYTAKKYKGLTEIQSVSVIKNSKGGRYYNSFGISGYLIDLNKDGVSIITISLPDEQTHEAFERAFNNAIDEEFEKLLEANPSLKQLYELNLLQEKLQEEYARLAKNGYDNASDNEKAFYEQLRKQLEEAQKAWEKIQEQRNKKQ